MSKLLTAKKIITAEGIRTFNQMRIATGFEVSELIKMSHENKSAFEATMKATIKFEAKVQSLAASLVMLGDSEDLAYRTAVYDVQRTCQSTGYKLRAGGVM